MKNLLLSYDDRIRPDSTSVYFKYAADYLLGSNNVGFSYPEDLGSVGNKYDLYLKIDDGLEQNRWNPSLHPSAYYMIDTHIDLEWRQNLAQEGQFDYLFFAQKKGVSENWHTDNKFWVPLACDPKHHYVGSEAKKYDVCFIGNFHSVHACDRIVYCDRLFKEFPEFFYGNRTFKDMAKKFSESRLVFNKSLNKDVNMRFFEAQCSGSALLTDVLPEQEELGFKEGIHYIGYNSEDEMVDKAKYYLEHDYQREKIAFTGSRLAQGFHTYNNRLNMLLAKTKMEVTV